MRLTLVRHGETTGESSVRYYGATDVPLSPLGVEQMRRAGTALAGERFDALYTSRLCRSVEGAHLLLSEFPPLEKGGQGGFPQLTPTPIAAFDEVDFGRWEGWTREEIGARDAAEYARWQAAPDDEFVYPEGECRQAFRRRVLAGFADILAADRRQRLLFVVHRGVIAIVLAELLGLHPDQRRGLQIDLGSIHVVVRDADGWMAEALNRIAHLAAPLSREGEGEGEGGR